MKEIIKCQILFPIVDKNIEWIPLKRSNYFRVSKFMGCGLTSKVVAIFLYLQTNNIIQLQFILQMSRILQ